MVEIEKQKKSFLFVLAQIINESPTKQTFQNLFMPYGDTTALTFQSQSQILLKFKRNVHSFLYIKETIVQSVSCTNKQIPNTFILLLQVYSYWSFESFKICDNNAIYPL